MMEDDDLVALAKSLNPANTNKPQQVQQALNYGTQFDPDAYAKAMKVAAQTGVAPTAALRDPKAFDRYAAASQVSPEDLVSLSPKLADKLVQDQHLAPVAFDDTSTLSKIENSFKDFAIQAGMALPRAMGGLLQATGGVWNMEGKAIQGLTGWDGLSKMGKAVYDYFKPLTQDPYIAPSTAVGKGTKFVGDIAGAMLKAGITGAATPLLFGGEALGNSFAGAQDQGATGGQAAVKAIGSGLLNAGLAYIPGGKWGSEEALTAAMSQGVKSEIAKELAKGVGARVIRGTALGTGMTLAENALEKATYNPDKPWFEGNAENVASFIGMEGAGYLTHAIFNPQAKQNLANKQLFEALGNLSQDSKLAKRDPEKFAQLVQHFGEGHSVTDVYVDRDALMTFFQDNLKMDPDQAHKAIADLGAVTSPAEAEATDKVQIPIGEFASKVATNPELYAHLDRSITFDAGDWSPNKQKAWEDAGGPALFQEAMKRIQPDVDPGVEASPDWKATYEDLRGRFGDGPGADDYARMMTNVFYNWGKESGLTAQEVLRIKDPKIVVGDYQGEGQRQDPIHNIDSQLDALRQKLILRSGGQDVNAPAAGRETSRAPEGNREGTVPAEVDGNGKAAGQPKPSHAARVAHGLVNALGDTSNPIYTRLGSIKPRSSEPVTRTGTDLEGKTHSFTVEADGPSIHIGGEEGKDGRRVEAWFQVMPNGDVAIRGVDNGGFAGLGDHLNRAALDFAKENYEGVKDSSVVFGDVSASGEKARNRMGTEMYQAPDGRRVAVNHVEDYFPSALEQRLREAGVDPRTATNEEIKQAVPELGDLFQGPVDRAGASLHTLGAERQDRVTGSRSTLAPEEKTVIQAGAKEHGFKAKDLEDQAREVKLRFPQADGWAKLVLNKVNADVAEDGSKKPILDWKVIPYSFDRIDGKSIKFESPEYNKRIELLGRNMRDEVLGIFQRAQNGDEAAKKIIAQSGWYREMRTRLRHEFGGLGDFMADNLGALSPNTDVMWNWKNGIDIVKRATRGDFDAEIPKWQAHFDSITQKENELKTWFTDQVAQGKTKKAVTSSPEFKEKYAEISALKNGLRDIMPVKENGAKYGFNGVNAMKAVVDLWRVIKEADPDIKRGGQAPKALNFSGNLIGFRERATIDVWAARMLNRLAGAERVPVPAESGVAGEMLPDGSTKGQFRAGQDAFTAAKDLIRAHDEMGQDPTLSKINDDDLQALVWFIEKEHWTKNNWTSAAGEGGSFELEANLAGTKDQQKVSELRSLINSTSTSPEAKVKAQSDLDALHRTMDRFTGGLSIQQSAGTQGQDFVPNDGAQAIVQQRLKNAIYSADPDAIVMGSKVMSTQGRYMGEGERSIDLEVTSREGYDPTNLHLEMLKLAQENNQQSMFFSRVLRAEEGPDSTRHRPGIEVYFKNKGSMEELQPLLDKLHKDMDFYTVVMNGRPTPETNAGAEGDVVGVRVQYMPEFMENFDGLHGLTPEEIGSRMEAQGQVLSDLADKIIEENPEVTSALRLWYDTEVTFANKYQEKIDALSGRNAGEGNRGAGEDQAQQSHARSLADAASFTEASSRTEGGNGEASGEPGAVPSGDATLFQPEVDGAPKQPRGWFKVRPDGTYEIGKTKIGDFSTFIHEPAHGYLFLLKDLAGRETASDALKGDAQKVLEFLGADSFDSLTRAQHEKWAEATEKYFQDGKAPSNSLQATFQRFAVWMKGVYQKAVGSGVELSDDIRGVMDRMYAAEEGVNKATEDLGPQLFKTPEEAGWTPEQFQKYADARGIEVEKAKQEILSKLNETVVRERSAQWREEERHVRETVSAQVDESPAYKAIRTLRKGEMEDGTPITLNKDELVKAVGEDRVKELQKQHPNLYRKEGGMDGQTAAELLGFHSIDGMVKTLSSTPKRAQAIEDATRNYMTQKHGDIRYDGSLNDKTIEAVINDQRAQRLHAEMEAIRTKLMRLNNPEAELAAALREAKQGIRDEQQQTLLDNKIEKLKLEVAKAKQASADSRQANREAMATAPIESFRATAAHLIENKTLSDLQPVSYLNGMRRFSREAYEKMAKGDPQGAYEAKQKELLNHFLYTESMKAKTEMTKFSAFTDGLQSKTVQGKLGKSGPGYLEQVNQLMSRYGISKGNSTPPQESLGEFAQRLYEDGKEPSIDPMLLNETRAIDWKKAPVSEVRLLRDALKNLKHLAYQELGITVAGKRIDYEVAKNAMIESARANYSSRTLPLDRNQPFNLTQATSDFLAKGDSHLMRMERMVEWLDGGVKGPWHDYLFNLMADAQGREYETAERITKKLAEALEAMPSERRMSIHDTRFNIPEVDPHFPVSKKYVLSVAMNMGNADNMSKMLRGMKWSEDTLYNKILVHMDRADWEFVQKTWNTLESLWPEIAGLEKRMTGLEPVKVQPQAHNLTLADGSTMHLDGGYYPLSYDPGRSVQGAKQETGDVNKLFEAGYSRATTPKGHTKERVAGFAAPLNLDYENVLTSHTTRVIKDLTHREAIIAANKLIMDQDVRSALQETMGESYEKQFLPWLRAIVNDRNGSATQGLSWINQKMMQLRSNMVLATMSYKVGTMLLQFGHIPRMTTYVKPGELASAYLDFLTHPGDIKDMIEQKSVNEMKWRGENLDRDLRENLQQMTGTNSLRKDVAVFGMQGIHFVDNLASTPLWLASYRQELKAGATEEEAVNKADRNVRLALGSGAPKDLPAVMRNNELTKLVTMFYGFHNGTYGQMRDIFHNVNGMSDLPKMSAQLAMTAIVPAILSQLVLGKLPDDEENKGLWAIKKSLLFSMDTIPVLRDFAMAMERGGDYKYTPLATAMEKSAKAAYHTLQDKPEKDWTHIGLEWADSVGYAAGIPGTGQAMKVAKYAHRVHQGKEPEPTATELLRNVTIGPPMKEKK